MNSSETVSKSRQSKLFVKVEEINTPFNEENLNGDGGGSGVGDNND